MSKHMFRCRKKKIHHKYQNIDHVKMQVISNYIPSFNSNPKHYGPAALKFIQDTTPEKRKQEADHIRQKYPDRIPVHVCRARAEAGLQEVDKHKYLVPGDITVSQF